MSASNYPPRQVIANMISLIEAQAVKATEERIVKLLQEHEVDSRRVKPTCYCGQQIYDIDKHRIELIKGEQKWTP